MTNKRVVLTRCDAKLHFAKEIMNVTGKSILDSKNIADLIVKPNGTLLLNESSITPEQWEEIVKRCPDVKFKYI